MLLSMLSQLDLDRIEKVGSWSGPALLAGAVFFLAAALLIVIRKAWERERELVGLLLDAKQALDDHVLLLQVIPKEIASHHEESRASLKSLESKLAKVITAVKNCPEWDSGKR
jgi:hypothetical protein